MATCARSRSRNSDACSAGQNTAACLFQANATRAAASSFLLTINKGGIIKYLDHADSLIARYHLPPYMKQRMELFKKDISSIFTEEPEKQKGLADFM